MNRYTKINSERFIKNVREEVIYRIGERVGRARCTRIDINELSNVVIWNIVYERWLIMFDCLERSYILNEADLMINELRQFDLYNMFECEKDIFNIVKPLSNYINMVETTMYIDNLKIEREKQNDTTANKND